MLTAQVVTLKRTEADYEVSAAPNAGRRGVSLTYPIASNPTSRLRRARPMRLKTFADVRAEIARAGLTQYAVAGQMRMDPGRFSRQTSVLNEKVPADFAARFTDALDALTRGIPTA